MPSKSIDVVMCKFSIKDMVEQIEIVQPLKRAIVRHQIVPQRDTN
jgi:hypothetical protein